MKRIPDFHDVLLAERELRETSQPLNTSQRRQTALHGDCSLCCRQPGTGLEALEDVATNSDSPFDLTAVEEQVERAVGSADLIK